MGWLMIRYRKVIKPGTVLAAMCGAKPELAPDIAVRWKRDNVVFTRISWGITILWIGFAFLVPALTRK